MKRIWWRFIPGLMVSFALVAVLIRAQPYDDNTVRALLVPPDCAMPCFMDIQPGVTTLEQALAILKASPWVDKVTDDPSTIGSSAVTWTWSQNKPAIIRDGSTGLLVAHSDATLGYIIDRVSIETTLPIGYVALLVFDQVTPITSGRNYADNQAYIETSDYHDSIRIWSIIDCPITKRKFFEMQARIDYNRQPAYARLSKADSGDFYWCWRHVN